MWTRHKAKSTQTKIKSSHMKRYYDLTKEEKLALSGEDIHDSIKLEAIHRAIKPPCYS